MSTCCLGEINQNKVVWKGYGRGKGTSGSDIIVFACLAGQHQLA